MNKYFSLFCCIALLSGCDKPEQPTNNSSHNVVADEQTASPAVSLASYDPSLPIVSPAQGFQSSELVLQAKSEAELTASLDSIVAKLTEAEKEVFAEAFFVYATSKIDVSLDDMTNRKNMLAALDNRSVDEIIQLANEMRASTRENNIPE